LSDKSLVRGDVDDTPRANIDVRGNRNVRLHRNRPPPPEVPLSHNKT
jgi:hypothetical protein